MDSAILTRKRDGRLAHPVVPLDTGVNYTVELPLPSNPASDSGFVTAGAERQ